MHGAQAHDPRALTHGAVLVTHQANLRTMEPLAAQLGMEHRIVVTDAAESGNPSAASIPLGFSTWWHAGRIPPGAHASLLGFGGGFAYASTVARAPGSAVSHAG